jgi:glucose-6-phosphate dehydrogenase assembly protein OpcA
MNDVTRAFGGEDISVDVAAIEKSLAALWRTEGEDSESGVTKAGLWNVIAHTTDEEQKTLASNVLGRASGSVPQRTMIIRSLRQDDPHIRSWISANCHLLGEGKQVCSEEIVIVAGGDRVDYVPPLVHALLMPELPVATWWLGDLPSEEKGYLSALLDPVDQLIVDSCDFNDVTDLAFLAECGAMTNTVPSDINWFRMEEWRTATATMFDWGDVLERARRIKRLTIDYGAKDEPFGDGIEALFYAAWLLGRLGYGATERGGVDIRLQEAERAPGQIARVSIEFDGGGRLELNQDDAARAIKGEALDLQFPRNMVTPLKPRDLDHIIVRQLSRSGADHLYADVLPDAVTLAGELRR